MAADQKFDYSSVALNLQKKKYFAFPASTTIYQWPYFSSELHNTSSGNWWKTAYCDIQSGVVKNNPTVNEMRVICQRNMAKQSSGTALSALCAPPTTTTTILLHMLGDSTAVPSHCFY